MFQKSKDTTKNKTKKRKGAVKPAGTAMKKHILRILLPLFLLISVLFFTLSCAGLTDLITQEFTVTFENWDGTKDTVKIKKGETLTPAAPDARPGYTFLGWYFGSVEWKGGATVNSNLHLVAKWSANKYKITFSVNGTETVVDADGGTLPAYPGTPEKPPEGAKQYVFTGWEPALTEATEDATYTAVFREEARILHIRVNPTYENAANIIFPSGDDVPYGADASITITVNEGYVFEGWYNPDGTPAVPELGEQTGTTITYTGLSDDLTLEARFSLVALDCRYDLPAGAVNGNPAQVTVEDGRVVLTAPTLEGKIFRGWFTEPNGEGESINYIDYAFAKAGKTAYAHFVSAASVTFTVNGTHLEDLDRKVGAGERLSAPDISPSDYGMSAYRLVKWYTSPTLSPDSEYDFTSPVTSDINLYSEWEYLGTNGFFAYADKFSAAVGAEKIEITSEDEFVAFIEYVQFYTVEKKVTISFPGEYSPEFESADALNSYMSSLIKKSSFPSGIPLPYSYTGSAPYRPTSVYFSGDLSLDASLTTPEEKQITKTKYLYAFHETSSGMGSGYDSFAIENLTRTVSVYTTNQLVYALEHGARPLPVAGSSAERIYEAAKNVLRKITAPGMSDTEKLRAIYEWLILNVSYDYGAAGDDEISAVWHRYTAWYAEGVFDSRLAVCDGIAKAYLIMARIENIACIRVSGTQIGAGGHAWNKVYVDGWYGVDATHGNLGVGDTELMTLTSFLFTDEYKRKTCTFDTPAGFESPDAPKNVYPDISVRGADGLPLSLLIESKADLLRLAAYIKKYAKNPVTDPDYYGGRTDGGTIMFEIAVTEDSGVTAADICSSLGITSYVPGTSDAGYTTYILRVPLS